MPGRHEPDTSRLPGLVMISTCLAKIWLFHPGSRGLCLGRSEEHTSELQYGYISYAVFCLKKKHQIAPAADAVIRARELPILGPSPPPLQLVAQSPAPATTRARKGRNAIRIFFFLMIRGPPNSTLFPSTTFFP